MPTRTPRIPDAALSKIPGKALYRMATAGAEVVIGGDHQTLVLPEARASKWGGECWLRVRHADADEIDRADKAAKAQGKALKTAEKASLRSEKGKPVLDIPTPGKGRRHEIREGSLKWNTVYDDASALPTDGRERYAYESSGLTWEQIQPLSAEQIAGGISQPDNIAGGWVAYGPKSGRYLDASGEEIANYETGRFCDVLPPLLIDAEGNQCYGTLEITAGEIIAVLPLEWLATAVFPVTLDPEFGFSTSGSSNQAIYNRTYAHAFKAGSTPEYDGVVSAISFWGNYFNSSENLTVGIYADSSNYPGSLLTNGVAPEFNSGISESGTVIQLDASFTECPSVASGTQYHFGMWGYNSGAADGTLLGYVRGDNTAGTRWYKTGQSYSAGTLPNPYPSSGSAATLKGSIWATYTQGGGGNTDSSADPGNIAISGSSATGVKASVSSVDSGTVAISGSVASGLRSLVSIAAAASIAIAGFSAEGVYTPTGSTVSSAVPGTVAISGSPANGVQTHISSADPGTIAILGSDANAATGYASTAEPGTVAISGADATASRTYVTTASPTSIAIAGSPAYATKSGGSSTSSGISLIFGKVILHL